MLLALLIASACGGPRASDPPVNSPPAVVSETPKNGAANVAPNTDISVSFSKAMAPDTLTGKTFIVTDGAGNQVAGSITTNGATAVFAHPSGLAYTTTYTAVVTAGARDIDGVPLSGSFQWSFTTSQMPDTTPPQISSASPAPASKNVTLTAALTVTFSEPVDPASARAGTSLTGAGQAIQGSITVAGAQLTFTPLSPLSYGTDYIAKVSGVKDLAGNAMTSGFTWSFTTVPPPDTTKPFVVSSSPPNGAQMADPSAVTVTFSEPVDPASVNSSTFIVRDPNGRPVAGAISVNGGSAAFTPSVPLSLNSPYTGEVNTGVRDLAGNPLAAVYTWGFRTTSALITGGRDHTVAMKSDGTLWGWGGNGSGQLGDGTMIDRSTPVQAAVSGPVYAAAGEYHTLAIKQDGTVWAWGRNDFGQLGNNGNTDSASPVQVSGLTNVAGLAGTLGTHSVALRGDGTVWAWGNNGYGQLGDGTLTTSHLPVKVSGLTGAAQVSAGWSHTIALKSDGTVWSWGRNVEGQLGNNSTVDCPVPVQAASIVASSVTGGGRHTLALKADGTVWAWGWNGSGQLGDGTLASRSIPAQVPGLLGVIAVAAGYSHSVALRSDGTVWAWGDNTYSQLGTNAGGNSVTSPVQVAGLSGIIAVGSGWSHIVALKNDGTLWALGYNFYGQLGNGTNVQNAVPVKVTGFVR